MQPDSIRHHSVSLCINNLIIATKPSSVTTFKYLSPQTKQTPPSYQSQKKTPPHPQEGPHIGSCFLTKLRVRLESFVY